MIKKLYNLLIVSGVLIFGILFIFLALNDIKSEIEKYQSEIPYTYHSAVVSYLELEKGKLYRLEDIKIIKQKEGMIVFISDSARLYQAGVVAEYEDVK